MIAGIRSLSLAALLLACRSGPAPQPGTEPPPVEPSDAASALGPGDVFDVRVYNEPDLSASYRVDADGFIDYPLLGRVKVAGLQPAGVARLIADGLDRAYVRQPQVSVFVKEVHSKKVSVFGQSTKPGSFPYVERMSILDALASAGGFTAMAARGDTTVTRNDGGAVRREKVAVPDIVEGKAPPYLLRPGDVVYVPERNF